MTLHGGEYAIHGTNQPSSIGGFVSYGCIRMYNQDIVDLMIALHRRVVVGTKRGAHRGWWPCRGREAISCCPKAA